MYWVEISDTAKHGTPPKLVPMEEAFNHTGFMSSYAYGTRVATWIENNASVKYGCMGSMVGLVSSQQPVYTDRLLVDFDENPLEDAKKLTNYLREVGIQYSVWASGGRSYHVHIHCIGKEDWRVPTSQKHWIASWADAMGAKVDLSVYHGASLFRLPNTVHDKTGKKKVLLDFFEGGLLDYDIVDATAPATPPENVKEAERMVWRMLLSNITEGGRHLHVYKIASQATRLGWNTAKITEHVSWWNSRLSGGKLSVDEIEEKIWRSV